METKTQSRIFTAIAAILLVVIAFLVAETRADTSSQAPQDAASDVIEIRGYH